MSDLIIKNALVIDGTGRTQYSADIAVKGGIISDIGRLGSKKAKRIVDAHGLAVAPGFIDSQNHSDSYWTIFDYPHQESMFLQGVTTAAVGHCGSSLAPLPSIEALKSVQKWHSLVGVNLNWRYFEEYLREIGRQELGVNFLSLVGHSTLRRGLVGDQPRPVTEPELKILERMCSNALKSGAAGVSFGLVYAHEFDSSSSELARLVKLAQAHDRSVSIHLRSEGRHVLESLDEILSLAEQTQARIKVSHLKVRGRQNWHLADQLIERLETAYQRGAKVRFDLYPYSTTWSVLYTYLPKWSYEGGRIELLKRLKQPYLRAKILHSLVEDGQALSDIKIATSSGTPHLIGKSLSEIAAAQGASVPETLLRVLETAEADVVVFDQNISQEIVERLLRHPLGIIASDGAGFDRTVGTQTRNLVHPRCFGTMARFLQLVRELKLMTLEQAVEKITALPAQLYNLPRRGRLAIGSFADITIFNPDTIEDAATLDNPFRPPSGIDTVVVNGTVTVENSEATGHFGGKVIKL